MTDQNQAGDGVNSQQQDGGGKPDVIPKYRFDEVNEQRKALADQLEQLKASQEAEKQAQLAEQGKFKEMFEGLQSKYADLEGKYKSATEKATAYDGYIETRKADLLADMSDEQKAAYGGLPLSALEQVAKDLKTNRGGGLPEDRPGHKRNIEGGPPEGMTLPEWAAKKPDEYKAWKAAGGYGNR